VARRPTTNRAGTASIERSMPCLGEIIAYCALAALQGLLVFLPRPAAPGWGRLRSPAWALTLPVALIIGTFGVLEVPGGATALAVLAAVTTPLLAGLAVMSVVRGSRRAWLAAWPLLGAAALGMQAWPAELATSGLAGLGCLTVGAALVRLTPLPWLAAGILAMCIVDVILLATGVGQPAAGLLEDALSHSALPEFHRAQIGSMNRDYPDLVLAAVLGTVLAGGARQQTAAVLVAVLASANGLLFLVADMLPGTVPLGVAAVVVVLLERRTAVRYRRRSRRRRPVGARPVERRPGPIQPMEA
jgi:hypothetical protein